MSGKIATLNSQIENFASETLRPKFRIKTAEVIDVRQFDEDNSYDFTFKIENIGGRAASEVVTRTILVDEGGTDEPQIVETALANDIPLNNPVTMHLELKCSRGDRPSRLLSRSIQRRPSGQALHRSVLPEWEGVRQACSEFNT